VKPGDGQAVSAGIVAGVVGFAGSFAVVLAGLRGVGASPAEAASGLMVLLVVMGLLAIALAVRTRLPVAIAWSTPGAALLATAGVPDGGFATAVAAFLLCGALLVLAGLWPWLGRTIDRIPRALAAAMLAGVLLPLCLEPFKAVGSAPELALPVIATWALLLRFARTWAVPACVVVAVAAVVVSQPLDLGPASGLAPGLELTVPDFRLGPVLALGVPLFVVTMVSQNVTGMAVLASFGFHPRWRTALTSTGVATIASAPFGGHAVNLAAITAALVAGPEAHPDPGRRWVAAAAGGVSYMVLGLSAAAATAFLAASPPEVLATVAGLALLAALGPALVTALGESEHREAALITFVVSASGVTLLSVTAAAWGLVAGLGFLALQRWTVRPSASPPSPATDAPRTATRT
jgi:benzoate membrane transport protein